MQALSQVFSSASLILAIRAAALIVTSTFLAAAPVPLVNPGAEINNGVDGSLVSDPAILGWDGSGMLSEGSTDFGNGRWKLTFEDSESVRQLTNHPIATGAAYSIRFDAALAGIDPSGEVLVGGALRNGDFNADSSATDSRAFADTPNWTNLGGLQTAEATKLSLDFDATRNAVVKQNPTTPSVHGSDTGYNLATGDVLNVSFVWLDALSWNDSIDRIAVTLFTTANNSLTGTATVIETLTTPVSTADGIWESFSADSSPIPASANGKRLFVSFKADTTDGNTAVAFARLDNFRVAVNDSSSPVVPTVVAEATIDNAGTPQVIASQSCVLLSSTVGQWNHYHFAIPAGTLDGFAGQQIGIRFRGLDVAEGFYQSIDNVRLDAYPSGSTDGAFSDDWNVSTDRIWVGPGYWGNRLHDWQVSGNRVNSVSGSRERLTLHRTGTSIRGNGGDFSLSVRTGLHAGTNNVDARTGFLIGAGPNLDWRASLLVHYSLGRDFGTFLGLDGNGAVVIEDFTKGGQEQVAAGVIPSGGFPADARLELSADYTAATGGYDLTIEAFDSGNTLLSTASTSVPSARVLGSFGLLCHRGNNNARFWYDDFSGAGDALEHEADRHLAIIGAMHSLHRGALKMTAQLPPLDIAATAPLTLETWNGATWNQVATAAVDNTDLLSSYTATFEVSPWNDSVDTPYRVGVVVDGSTYHWGGTVRHDPVEKNEIVVVNTSCQIVTQVTLPTSGFDWSPTKVWHPHLLGYAHIAKQHPDVFLALGDQLYESNPTLVDNSSGFNRQHDYLFKWYLWMLQSREITRDMPTISLPDDHDVFQGNLWGEDGAPAGNPNAGGYVRPADWVKLVERTQTSHLPATDPYNPIQPPPPVEQGIETYFTGMSYGQVGFGILEDRKFKTGPVDAPTDPDEQFLLGRRQKDFLRAWSTDWVGQRVKCAVSQSPFGMLHTHGGFNNYAFDINDKDTHGWPFHRRKEAWELLRLSRSFQLAGDQHISTLVHHGIDGPVDAGYSFASPAMANFFPRVWNPVHNAGGTTNTVSPYKGDFYFDGSGTLPSGQPNLTSEFPHHLRMVAAANPLLYYNQTTNIDPVALHDKGTGYGIIRIDKTTRQITFECWPHHADPEYPQTGSQYADWPVTINQADNDGRAPTGFLAVIDTLSEKTPVVSVYDENTSELVYSMRFPGNLVRPPVYDNDKTYRVEIAYGDDPVSEVRYNQVATVEGPAAVHSFTALAPSIVTGEATTLQWNVESVATLTIDHGIGDVASHTVNGIGHVRVSPTANTTYTLTLNGGLTVQATVLVFPGKQAWLDTYFSGPEQGSPGISGDSVDDDGDGFTNRQEFVFQTNPRDPLSFPVLTSQIVAAANTVTVDFSSPFPLGSDQCIMVVEASSGLGNWLKVPSNGYQEIGRINNPIQGTTRITIRLTEGTAGQPKQFYRAKWVFPE